jgi:hypothetical protein
VAFEKIGIMSIGEMGFHWAKLLKGHGVEVLTYDKDRGEVSRKRGQNAGVVSLDSMTDLVDQADLIVSIVVPSAAIDVAKKVAEAVKTARRKDLIFLDANAISPMAAEEIGKNLEPAGVSFRRWLHHWLCGENGKGHDCLCFRARSEPPADSGETSIFRSRFSARARVRLPRSRWFTPD